MYEVTNHHEHSAGEIVGKHGLDRLRQTAFGVWVINDDTHFTKWIEETGRLDHHQGFLATLLPFIPKGGVAVDAGAYIGDHTIAYSNAVGPTGTVFAFEPNLLPFICMQRNCPDVIGFMAGLGSKPGLVGYSEAEGNIGAGRLASLSDATSAVPLLALDYVRMPRLDYFKLDIEGCETDALRGARKTLDAFKPIMCLEISDGHLRRQGSSREELFQLLESYGYSIRFLSDHPVDRIQYDCLAIPNQILPDPSSVGSIPLSEIAQMNSNFRGASLGQGLVIEAFTSTVDAAARAASTKIITDERLLNLKSTLANVRTILDNGQPQQALQILLTEAGDCLVTADALTLRGDVEFFLKRFEEALASYKAGIAIDPKHRDSNIKAIDLSLRLNRLKEMRNLISAADRCGLKDVRIDMLNACYWLHQGNYLEADAIIKSDVKRFLSERWLCDWFSERVKQLVSKEQLIAWTTMSDS
ncbi:FkbM family methyltransferase [Asticcacaulis sp.]|uniref:FkbM family methyltransferase n=1 Tax=Asticcacaulis sp. TaxID=1872648 RepID=UPI00260167EF|nr:FkbM family methyltransferase [Asticcacaulis sp.]